MDPIVYLAKNNNAGALDMQKFPLKQLSTIEIGTRISSEIPFDRSSSDSVSTKMHTHPSLSTASSTQRNQNSFEHCKRTFL